MMRKLRAALRESSDLARVENKASGHPLSGLCYIASEALFHLMPGRFVPNVVKHDGVNHWFLKCKNSKQVVDLTVDQFATKPDYSKAKPCGFLTRQPSKRTLILLERINGKLANGI